MNTARSKTSRAARNRVALQRRVRLTASLFTRISKKLRLPFKLHRSGKGKPGEGSCWCVESVYPVNGFKYPGIVCAFEPTLHEALETFYKKLSEPNSELSSGGPADKRQQTEQAARRLLK